MKHEFIPAFGSAEDTCLDCGEYLYEGSHYSYTDESEFDGTDEDDKTYRENTILNYETDEGGL